MSKSKIANADFSSFPLPLQNPQERERLPGQGDTAEQWGKGRFGDLNVGRNLLKSGCSPRSALRFHLILTKKMKECTTNRILELKCVHNVHEILDWGGGGRISLICQFSLDRLATSQAFQIIGGGGGVLHQLRSIWPHKETMLHSHCL